MPESAALSTESLPLHLELRIDAVCRIFEAAWKAAANGNIRPRIEDYLPEYPSNTSRKRQRGVAGLPR
jgi:hypothetical protein